MSVRVSWSSLATDAVEAWLQASINAALGGEFASSVVDNGERMVGRPPPTSLGTTSVSGLSLGLAPPEITILSINDVDKKWKTEHGGAFAATASTIPSSKTGLSSRDSAVPAVPPHSGKHRAAGNGNGVWNHGRPNESASRRSSGGRSASPGPWHRVAADSPDYEMSVRVRYAGDLSFHLATEVHFNVPTPGFLVIPVTCKVSGIVLDGVGVVISLGDRVAFTFAKGVGRLGDQSPSGQADWGPLKKIEIKSEIGESSPSPTAVLSSSSPASARPSAAKAPAIFTSPWSLASSPSTPAAPPLRDRQTEGVEAALAELLKAAFGHLLVEPNLLIWQKEGGIRLGTIPL